MNSLLAIALSFSCIGYDVVDVGIQGEVNKSELENTIIWITDVAFSVDPDHIEKFDIELEKDKEPAISLHIRNPEKPEEFFQLDSKDGESIINFDYKGVHMEEKQVYCEFSE